MDPIFVYVTCADREEATRIGLEMVETKLAACANVIDGMTSIYRWEGKIETAQEAILILKTQVSLLDQLTAAVKGLHSYSVPCVVALPIVGGNPDYLSWLMRETMA
jgi:periplasmic divalent cation tolerance protein